MSVGKVIGFCCLSMIRLFLELLARIVFYIKYRNYESKHLPPITNKYLLEPAVSLAEKIRSREVTSQELVQAFIDRIEDTNPHLNAMIECGFGQALDEAKRVDRYLSENPIDCEELQKTKPFLGVPFTAKDCFQIKGFRQTAGLYGRKDIISEDDGGAVICMKDAGAIILGTTNVPEMAMWWESSNTIYGTTCNPYAFNRGAGGSSGGEGSIISAAGSPMGLGSDIGGSIRIPAFFNGIFGHKASPDISNLDGHFPAVSETLSKYPCSGPMSRHSKDLRPILKLILTPEGHRLVNFDRKVDLKDLKIFYMESDGGAPLTTPVTKEVKVALLKTVDYFRNVYHIPCKKVHLSNMKHSADIMLYKLREDELFASFGKTLALGKGEVNIWLEILKMCVGIKGLHTAASLEMGALMKLFNPKLRPEYYKSMMEACEELRSNFKEMLQDNCIFLYPPHPTPAVYHSESLFRPANPSYTGIFNVMGLPTTQCPVGLSSSGLPLGVQVVGGLYQDDLCLQVAEEIDRAFGGWVCPSNVKLS